jgi:predicted metal-dependent enzyme (double-stranded beta helix superfamily)
VSSALPRPYPMLSESRRPAAAGRRRWRDGPTPIGLSDLTVLTRAVADEVRSGRYTATVDAACRWSQRLHADAYLDIWLIGWAPTQAAELHDHGGSLGALTVVEGELSEWRWSSSEADRADGGGHGLHRRALRAGRGAAFALGHVHDVSNRATDPAVSVHAYSPPLSTMSYYVVEGGMLRRTRSELVPPGAPPDQPHPSLRPGGQR